LKESYFISLTTLYLQRVFTSNSQPRTEMSTRRISWE